MFLEDCKNIICSILTTKKSFAVCFEDFQKTNIRNTKDLSIIKKIISIFFKKYFYYENLSKYILGRTTPSLVAYLGSSVIALKILNFNQKEVYEILKNVLSKNKAFDKEIDKKINELLTKSKEGKDLVLPKENSIFSELSIIFNLPIWLIKMIIHQNDNSKAKAILNSFKGKNKRYYLRNCLDSIDDFDTSLNSNYIKLENENYLLNSKISNLEKDKGFIETYNFYKTILKEIGKFNNKYVTFYTSENNNFVFEFTNLFAYKNNVINIGVDSYFTVPGIAKDIITRHIENIFAYEATEGQMIAKLSDKQDLLIYAPKSSNFMRFYFENEYRVNFDPENLDSIISNEKNGLQELSQHCGKNGLLCYVVNTLNFHETHEIIDDFLKNNCDYKLVNKKEIIPDFDKKEICFYAILKRVSND